MALNSRRMRLCGGVFVSSSSSDCVVVMCDVWLRVRKGEKPRGGSLPAMLYFLGFFFYWISGFLLHPSTCLASCGSW